jgi:hypothetical protein
MGAATPQDRISFIIWSKFPAIRMTQIFFAMVMNGKEEDEKQRQDDRKKCMMGCFVVAGFGVCQTNNKNSEE